jgi:hypothetical protein
MFGSLDSGGIDRGLRCKRRILPKHNQKSIFKPEISRFEKHFPRRLSPVVFFFHVKIGPCSGLLIAFYIGGVVKVLPNEPTTGNSGIRLYGVVDGLSKVFTE